MTTTEMAQDLAGLVEPAEQYRELVSYNGRVQNMALRRMSDDRLAALGEYAATQSPEPFSNVNIIQAAVSREKRARR